MENDVEAYHPRDTDMYSLGAILYEMISGTIPEKSWSEKYFDYILQHIKTTPPMKNVVRRFFIKKDFKSFQQIADYMVLFMDMRLNRIKEDKLEIKTFTNEEVYKSIVIKRNRLEEAHQLRALARQKKIDAPGLENTARESKRDNLEDDIVKLIAGACDIVEQDELQKICKTHLDWLKVYDCYSDRAIFEYEDIRRKT